MEEKVVWQPKPRKKYERRSDSKSDVKSDIESKTNSRIKLPDNVPNVDMSKSELRRAFEEGLISLTTEDMFIIFLKSMIIDNDLATSFSVKDIENASITYRFGDAGVQVVIKSYQTESVFIHNEDIIMCMVGKISTLTERVNKLQSLLKNVLFK